MAHTTDGYRNLETNQRYQTHVHRYGWLPLIFETMKAGSPFSVGTFPSLHVLFPWNHINPHPVMSSDLHGPPAGPRRPGIMIFKFVEFLVQIKNKNSPYWLSHITTALNCKICLFFLASILCHVRNMIKKYMGENVNKIHISAINENRFFCYIHAHSNKNYVYDGFI